MQFWLRFSPQSKHVETISFIIIFGKPFPIIIELFVIAITITLFSSKGL